jgi:hypothetical protein
LFDSSPNLLAAAPSLRIYGRAIRQHQNSRGRQRLFRIFVKGSSVSGNRNGVSPDEDTEHGSSAEAKRAVSTTRVREFRKRQKLGLMVRKVRITPGTVRKLIALGYLEREGDEQAEGMAIEAYLGDSL